MRSLVLAAILLVALLPLPGAAAKPLLDDASGDASVAIFGLGPGVPAPAGQGDGIDLLSMEVLETAEEITFVLLVTNLQQPVTFAQYHISFVWARDQYRVVAQRVVAPPVIEGRTEAFLLNDDREEDRWEPLAYLDHTFDLAANTITVHVPKAYILSEDGRYPVLGDSLKEVQVYASSRFTFFQFTADSYDRMPDDGSADYAFLYGDLAKGHLRLDANERVRVSNGGATTFVYQVVVSNAADLDDDVSITLGDMPEGWNGTVQSPLRLPGGTERRVAILVSVPFAHDHGGFSSFNVTATSARDPASLASLRLGVLHTPIPQPAGHHKELYLHARSFDSGILGQMLPFTEATMNTDADHTGDAPEATPRGGDDDLEWRIELTPGLRMGLDFDVEETGEIVGSIVGHTQTAGTLRGELLLIGAEGEEQILLAETDAVDLTLDVSNPAPFKLTLTPLAEADYIPYVRGQNLMLVLSYEASEEGIGRICCIPGTTPGLRTEDFKATLPLNEYHDRLTGLSEVGDLLELKAEGAVEKTGLPGATMTYAFTLVNRGQGEEIVDIDVAGTDAELGTLVPSGSIALGPGESRKVTLAVTIPADRNDGEELEVLLFAHSVEDPSKSAIARTKTIVAKQGSGEAQADETALLHAAQAEEANDTPAPGAGLVLGLLGGAAFMWRRRAP